MDIIETRIDDVLLIKPSVYGDDRGFFMESFNQAQFDQLVSDKFEFVQDNHSRSGFGVLRGLHYQIKKPQGKLVRVVHGSVFDVAVDLRRSSSNFGNWVGVELSDVNKLQLWVPPGFAHGFMVTSPTADFLYKTTDFYAPEYERCIKWDDDNLGIQWPSNDSIKVSEKDSNGLDFTLAETYL